MYYRLIELQENPMRYSATKERLSGFEEFYLHELGNAMRKSLPESQHFWRCGAYCWYTDSTQSEIQKVRLLESGACIFTSFEVNAESKVKYYKVEFKY
jgi:hypothetical protein